MSAPSNHTSRESADSAPALSIHTKQVIPPLRHHSFPPVPLPVARTLQPPRYSFAPAKRPVCAAPPRSPTLPLRHRPNSAQTASAAATKTKNRQSVSALPESAPTPAAAFPLQDELYTFPEPLSPAQILCRPSSSNLFPAAPAACRFAPGRKKLAPTLDWSHRAADQSCPPHVARSDRQKRVSRAQSHPPRAVKPATRASAPSAFRPDRRTAPSHT